MLVRRDPGVRNRRRRGAVPSDGRWQLNANTVKAIPP
jgi:hypothetical protein